MYYLPINTKALQSIFSIFSLCTTTLLFLPSYLKEHIEGKCKRFCPKTLGHLIGPGSEVSVSDQRALSSEKQPWDDMGPLVKVFPPWKVRTSFSTDVMFTSQINLLERIVCWLSTTAELTITKRVAEQIWERLWMLGGKKKQSLRLKVGGRGVLQRRLFSLHTLGTKHASSACQRDVSSLQDVYFCCIVCGIWKSLSSRVVLDLNWGLDLDLLGFCCPLQRVNTHINTPVIYIKNKVK